MEGYWNGELYCDITLKWNYKEGYVDISMPNYVHKKLFKYKHTSPPSAAKIVHMPHHQ